MKNSGKLENTDQYLNELLKWVNGKINLWQSGLGSNLLSKNNSRNVFAVTVENDGKKKNDFLNSPSKGFYNRGTRNLYSNKKNNKFDVDYNNNRTCDTSGNKYCVYCVGK